MRRRSIPGKLVVRWVWDPPLKNSGKKGDTIEDYFYERCPRHDIRILLGDFNARMGKDGIFAPPVRKFSLHNETSGNGQRLIDFTPSVQQKTYIYIRKECSTSKS